jgi:hypothetical protein
VADKEIVWSGSEAGALQLEQAGYKVIRKLPNVNPTGEKTMDLGNIIGDVIGGVTQYQIAKLAAKNQPAAFFPGSLPDLAGDVYSALTDQQIVDAGGVVNLAPRKKKCRRRRRLATMSDIRDLAALKSILGNGETFRTWIATHPS